MTKNRLFRSRAVRDFNSCFKGPTRRPGPKGCFPVAVVGDPYGMRQLARRLVDFHDHPGRWLVAAIAFGLAFVLRLVLDDVLPPGFPFLTFFPAVILTTFVGGLGPGVAVVVASTLTSWFFFIPPFGGFGLDGPATLALGFFVVIAAVDVAIIHLMFQWLQELDKERKVSRELATSRDLMFQEMQHRISNNISVVSALLRMQQRAVQDEAATKALDNAATRLALIGKIHRKLHNPDGQQLPFTSFVADLCQDVLEASGAGDQVDCKVEGDELYLSSDRAVPVALIVAELVSNSLEHGFQGREHGSIRIEIRRQPDEQVLLTIRDDGHGLPEGFDLASVRSLGLLVARNLSKQIGATFSMQSVQGTKSEIRFSDT